MSLKHALLGFLNYGPMTGYELKKFFDTSVNHFWSAELSQIYPTLKQLEAEGLVDMKLEVQEDRPNRKVYHITDDGRRELLEWLTQPTEPEQLRVPLLIKLFFGAATSKQDLINVLRRHAEEMERKGHLYEHGCDIIQSFAEAIGLKRDAFLWRLTVEIGVHYCQSEVERTEAAIRKIEAMDESIFQRGRRQARPVDVHKAVEILDHLRGELPEAFASSRANNGTESPQRPRLAPRLHSRRNKGGAARERLSMG